MAMVVRLLMEQTQSWSEGNRRSLYVCSTIRSAADFLDRCAAGRFSEAFLRPLPLRREKSLSGRSAADPRQPFEAAMANNQQYDDGGEQEGA